MFFFSDLSLFSVKTDLFIKHSIRDLINGSINQQNSQLSQRCINLSLKRLLFTKKYAKGHTLVFLPVELSTLMHLYL